MIPAIETRKVIPAAIKKTFHLLKCLSASLGSIWSWNILVFLFQTIKTKYIHIATVSTPITKVLKIAGAIPQGAIIRIKIYFLFSLPEYFVYLVVRNHYEIN